MSLQFTDTLRFRGYTYELLQITTEEGLADPRDFGLEPEMIHTACYRGFYLRYSLTRKGLFLRWMTVRDRRGHYPPIRGVEPILGPGGYTAVYRGLEVPVPYTGGLRIGREPLSEAVQVWDSISPQVDGYRSVLQLTLEEGRLAECVDISEHAARWRAERLDADSPEART
jgi:hypothetical protein